MEIPSSRAPGLKESPFVPRGNAPPIPPEYAPYWLVPKQAMRLIGWIVADQTIRNQEECQCQVRVAPGACATGMERTPATGPCVQSRTGHSNLTSKRNVWTGARTQGPAQRAPWQQPCSSSRAAAALPYHVAGSAILLSFCDRVANHVSIARGALFISAIADVGPAATC